jgi:hypothetical protein
MSNFELPSEIQETGDWATDNVAGRNLATAWIEAARAAEDPCLINSALRGLAEAGRWGGVEVGFAFAVAGAVLN